MGVGEIHAHCYEELHTIPEVSLMDAGLLLIFSVLICQYGYIILHFWARRQIEENEKFVAEHNPKKSKEELAAEAEMNALIPVIPDPLLLDAELVKAVDNLADKIKSEPVPEVAKEPTILEKAQKARDEFLAKAQKELEEKEEAFHKALVASANKTANKLFDKDFENIVLIGEPKDWGYQNYYVLHNDDVPSKPMAHCYLDGYRFEFVRYARASYVSGTKFSHLYLAPPIPEGTIFDKRRLVHSIADIAAHNDWYQDMVRQSEAVEPVKPKKTRKRNVGAVATDV